MKQKILCLHGYRQDGETFKKKIGAFRKRLKATAEFVFLDGTQIVVPGDESGIEGEEGRAGGRGWWFSREDDYFRATYHSDYVKGFQASVTAVEEFLVSEGPFDGILGFSQGAALAAMLCVLKQRGELKQGADFGYVILVSAFKSRSTPHNVYYNETISIPSLHVIGTEDKVIEESMSLEVASLFTDHTLVKHEGGHYVPSSAEVANGCKQFLSRFAK